MSAYNYFLAAVFSLSFAAPVWSSEAPVNHANSNANSREVASALGGITNKTFSLKEAPILKVATFNIAAGKVSDMTAIAKAIKAMNVDIVALQEVDKLTARSGKVDQLAELMKLTGMYGVFGRAIDFDGGQYGLAYLSKYPIKDQVIYPLPSGQREQRIAFVAKVEVPNFAAPITVVNAHLDTKEDPTMRLEQVRELNDRTIEIRGIKLLFGDMNDVPRSVTWQELDRYWNDIQPENRDGRSWPAENAEIKVDYIFTGNAQRWHLDSLTIPNANGEWSGVNWPLVSDHLPIVAELRMTEQ
ncbi:endonuclease/exonuclease/phosphatase family protein [Pragia fontium]|uniref:Metal-dependent hydrolase, endonuclease/exonuclease/phosphatase family n=1 Tax=Pragia fontium DSM 5563 = ATCC 49100 TaxID=1122977 RepID=A0AAJ5BHQ6_9GAMM|nr:endonuclease/exonuclease/phosphatase family protein [Pragia fontium]SFD05741.1 Metal-dependent hydrolase, endonuclease/exonuclease/phosphatase family [Pragia fontium DSM 5563 = ATCC 49100]